MRTGKKLLAALALGAAATLALVAANPTGASASVARDGYGTSAIAAMAKVHTVAATAVDPDSAFGAQPIGTFVYSDHGVTITVPTGCFLQHWIHGAGKNISYEEGGTDCAGPGYWFGGFCNWRMEFQYEDLNGHVYAGRSDGLHSECTYDATMTFGQDKLPVPGKACATFFVANKQRARQCHNILN